MSDNIDALFERIERDIEENRVEAPEVEVSGNGVVAVRTAAHIHDMNPYRPVELNLPDLSRCVPRSVMREQDIGLGATIPSDIDFRDVDYRELMRICAMTDAITTLQDIADMFNVSLHELYYLRRHPGYVRVVEERLMSYGAERLLEKSSKWVTPIDQVYARYFRCPVYYIRQILHRISPDIPLSINRESR